MNVKFNPFARVGNLKGSESIGVMLAKGAQRKYRLMSLREICDGEIP
jgi:hypothetical protein